MNIKQFLEDYRQHPKIQLLASQYSLVQGLHVSASGIKGSALSVILAALLAEHKQHLLVVLNDAEEAAYFRTDFENLTGMQVLLFPESYRKSFIAETIDNELVLQRAEVLSRMNTEQEALLIASYPQALAEKVISRDNLSKNSLSVTEKDPLDLDFLMDLLAEYDFERVDFVAEAGQYAIRGGIIDVFSFGNEQPYRLELDGDEVESIRIFDPETQLSVKRIPSASIIPNIQQKQIAGNKISFFDYLPKSSLVCLQEGRQLIQGIEEGFRKAMAYHDPDHLPEDWEAPETLFEGSEQVKKRLKAYAILELGNRPLFKAGLTLAFNMKAQPNFNKNFDLIIQHLKENQQAGVKNLIFSETAKQIERLYAIFHDIDPSIEFDPVYKGLSAGFTDDDIKWACFTDHQLFDRYYRYKTHKKYSSARALSLKELTDLKPGDYVVHIDHGIGRFGGLEKIEMNGVMQEAVRLVYKNNDLLYVNINSLHKISKYVGKDGVEPKMHKLGSDAWEKLKANTKSKVKDIARDLIKLYAARKAQQGFAFSPDNYLQTELEASFIYEDTPDQSKATEDLKKDMEQPHPMDRLVCGDVGFGKTEVAIRAAFKAVCDSKQVAVLVPTTILAQQHYKTFRQRLKSFPCRVDFINRFRTAKEQSQILKDLAEGKIDILIGTHKLISEKIKFKDLGLLIIDEEQKFGVAAKEKLKHLRVNVDTLTLTATPIPRTLHFSLMGARDLSVINTPPPNRQPVKTELHLFNKAIIKEAINHEVERGGQLFFIHHRVKDIEDVANMIRDLCPYVKVAVAHGQLDGPHLEDVMIKFMEGEFDVLVATTLIESGLDIPNANTIIINNAHMFGLSDLHQMRGRVGRSNRKAYCYLMAPALSTLTDEARKRLSAIEQFSDLGSGFQVAMRDLDIRGAGNLLGAEQSGFIAEIGYELYHKILDEAVQELKHEEFKTLFPEERPQSADLRDCQIEANIEMVIPDAYVRNIAERLSLYSELSSINNHEQLEAYAQRLTDRFGNLPQALKNLFLGVQLKWAGKKLGFEKILMAKDYMQAWFPATEQHPYFQSSTFGHMLRYAAETPRTCQLKQGNKGLSMIFKGRYTLTQALELMQQLLQFAERT